MSLSLYRIPDGQTKGQSELPCPSVYAPASALRSLSSVALSSEQAAITYHTSQAMRDESNMAIRTELAINSEYDKSHLQEPSGAG